jgi:phospholipid/cholesterol/gamma-HCH transport system permease protein
LNLFRPIARFGYQSQCALRVLGGACRQWFRMGSGAVTRQLGQVALSALPLVGVAHFFAGMVIVLQSAVQFGRFGSNHLVADVIAISLVRELAPVFTALLMAGKAGAGLASELGMLVLSGQTRAMRALSIDINRHVVAPRFWAAVWGTVLLTIAAMFMGLLGGMILAESKLGVSMVHFLNRAIDAIQPVDLACGLFKAGGFGVIVATLGCTYGLKPKKDARELGQHTMQAVVIGSFCVLVSDHLFTSLIVAVWG